MTQNPDNPAGKAITGGEWLIRKTAASDIFIPEEWNEEQLMMKQMTQDFIQQNILNQLDAIDDCGTDLLLLRRLRLAPYHLLRTTYYLLLL